MRLRHVVPFLVLFAWQVAPPPRQPDRPPRLRLWYGGGWNSFDYAYWGWSGATCECPDCGHRQREETKEENASAGLQLDAWPSPTVRVSGAAGAARTSGSAEAAFVAGLAAWEGPLVGLGLGWAAPAASRPNVTGFRGPGAYVRLGSLDGAHLRADLRAPTVTPGVTGWARVGLAYNQRGQRSGPSIFVGVSAVEAGPDTTYAEAPAASAMARLTRPAFFVDYLVPLGRNVDVFARGHLAKKARGFGGGVALRLAR